MNTSKYIFGDTVWFIKNFNVYRGIINDSYIKEFHHCHLYDIMTLAMLSKIYSNVPELDCFTSEKEACERLIERTKAHLKFYKNKFKELK